MAVKTWVLKVNGRQFQAKMLKAKAERLAHELSAAASVSKSWKEISGVVGGESRECILSSVFGLGKGQIADPEGYKRDLTDLFDGLPEIITESDYLPIAAKARAVFVKHLPVVDERETPEQVQERQREYKEAEQKRVEQAQAWLDVWADQESVIVPEDYMAVYIELDFNNSDSMTDYFDRHCQWGQDLLLAIVPKGRECEATARRIVALYPELTAQSWTWHTENYSMGHGNWLESGVVSKAVGRDVYNGGGSDPPVWFEVRFNSWEHQKPMRVFRGYPGTKAPETKAEPVNIAGENGKATITQDRDWLWVKFPAKPSQEILDGMKGLGGRFSGKRQAWYFTDASLLPQVQAVVEA